MRGLNQSLAFVDPQSIPDLLEDVADEIVKKPTRRPISGPIGVATALAAVAYKKARADTNQQLEEIERNIVLTTDLARRQDRSPARRPAPYQGDQIVR